MNGPLKWHGGKRYLAKKIVALFPPHLHYVEPYAGGLSVLLERDPADKRLWLGTSGSNSGVSEVVNDKSRLLTNFWTTLQHHKLFQEMHRRLQAIPLSRWEWEDARAFLDANPIVDKVSLDHACAFFVLCRQSLAGRMTCFTSLTRSRTRRGINGNLSEWLGAIDGLPAVHERLRQVVIENTEAVKLIHREDGEGTLMYLDPPYVHSTRATTTEYGEFEMDEMRHRELLATLVCEKRKSKFLLSGYDCPLYREFLGGWTRHTFEVPNAASGAKKKEVKTECVWANF